MKRKKGKWNIRRVEELFKVKGDAIRGVKWRAPKNDHT